MAYVVGVLLVALAIGRCAGWSQPRLDDRTFTTTAISDARPGTVYPASVSLAFTGYELYTSAGCNSMNGQYQIRNDTLVMFHLVGTLLICEPPLDAKERWLFEFLSSSPRVTLTGNELVLEAPGVRVRLEDFAWKDRGQD